MDGKGPSYARRLYRGVEDGVIGGVEDAVAEPGDGKEDEDLPIGGGKPHQADAHRHDHQAGGQHYSRADPVDQEAHRHLGDGGKGEGHGQDGAKGGVTDPELGLEDEEQRRQAEEVEMGQEMAGADDAQDLAVLSYANRGGRFHLAGSFSKFSKQF